MEIQPENGSRKQSAERFTGDVWINRLFRGQEPSRVRISTVRFAPAARAAWHAHAIGQTLYVIEGKGWIQSRGGRITEIRAGQVIWTPGGEWHWHGATDRHFMSHQSITEADSESGSPDIIWGEHVTDDEYNGASWGPMQQAPRNAT